MQKSTKYSSKAVDIIVYLLFSANLLTCCLSYLNLSNRVEMHKEEVTIVTNANLAKIAELTIQLASMGSEIDKLRSKNEALIAEASILNSKIDRIEGSYPFTTVYDLARIACQGYDDVTPELVLAVARLESGFDPSATNGETIGLMQINPRWHKARAERLGVLDFSDPYGSILLGTDYLHEIHQDLISQTGIDDWNYVLMIYNMRRDVANSLYHQGIISDYAKTVMNYYDEYKYLFSLLGDI